MSIKEHSNTNVFYVHLWNDCVLYKVLLKCVRKHKCSLQVSVNIHNQTNAFDVQILKNKTQWRGVACDALGRDVARRCTVGRWRVIRARRWFFFFLSRITHTHKNKHKNNKKVAGAASSSEFPGWTTAPSGWAASWTSCARRRSFLSCFFLIVFMNPTQTR